MIGLIENLVALNLVLAGQLICLSVVGLPKTPRIRPVGLSVRLQKLESVRAGDGGKDFDLGFSQSVQGFGRHLGGVLPKKRSFFLRLASEFFGLTGEICRRGNLWIFR